MKKKIAILGGGCASMTAAYYLSNTPELRDALDVTVYQMGWRLGGKGASGRRAAMHDRIEEHGLHVWGGFYYNAFRMMRECYDALQRPPGPALTDVWNTFIPHDVVAWGEHVDEKWVNWILHVPSDAQKPGHGPEYPSLWSQIERILGWIRDAVFNWPHEHVQDAARNPATFGPEFRLVSEAFEEVTATTAVGALDALLLVVSRLAQQPAENHSALDYAKVQTMLRSLDSWLERMILEIVESHNESRRIFGLVDLGLALISGIIADRLYSAGFMAVDDYDFAEWLGKHGAVQQSLESAPLRGYYDYFFAYQDGDANKPRMSAGMGIAHLLRLIGAYKGSLFWKMQSGMGDAVFAPLYQLCQHNGVRFEFFHRVDALVPSSDGTIATIRINKQVTLKDGTYDPLVFPKNVPSWPSEPNWQFIDDGEAAEIKKREVNLEDPWTDWPGTGFELSAGRDFDAVVLGLSIGAFGMVCKSIVASNPVWATMVEKLQTIQTQAMQLWFAKNTTELGWSAGNATGTAYAQPLESWSDMTGALERETWPEGPGKPETITYFCGPMQNPLAMPEGIDPDYGRRQSAKAHDDSLAWLQANVRFLYPNMASNDDVVSQYTRANYTPTERYVVDLPGTNQYRLEADTSGFDNLALAGDWLFTGLGGAVESAVISGMQAARALVGTITDPIVGEVKSPWPRKVSVKRVVGSTDGAPDNPPVAQPASGDPS